MRFDSRAAFESSAISSNQPGSPASVSCPLGWRPPRLVPRVMTGRAAPSPLQPHVFLNQSCGRKWSSAASGPRLNASTRMQMSSGSAFAYSMTMSK